MKIAGCLSISLIFLVYNDSEKGLARERSRLNVVKAGSTIPLKFSLAGDPGLSIFAVGFPKSQKIACDSSAQLDTIEETVTAGYSSLSYDPTTDQYNYVWKTDKLWAGTCRQLTVTLIDGTSYVANFKFNK